MKKIITTMFELFIIVAFACISIAADSKVKTDRVSVSKDAPKVKVKDFKAVSKTNKTGTQNAEIPAKNKGKTGKKEAEKPEGEEIYK